VDSVVIALLDVLSGFEELNICEAYDINGKVTRDLPSRCEDLAIAKPVLRRIAGWSEDITNVRRFEDLPVAAQEYVKVAAELIGRPVSIVSVGPDREQTIHIAS
ncbi:MAG: adenylosuccinate synthetase, partial [Fuerstiella sp.]|nr:adenylosuccinate synthetase [Fuerstiella sp.]